jgi:very-short-patch-repair endonuclease
MTSHHAPGAIARTRYLRRNMTKAETALWTEVRKLGLGIRRQAPIKGYIVDFVHHRSAEIIELDGGRHDDQEAQLHDLERTTWLESQGYRVLRFQNADVLADPRATAQVIATAIRFPKAIPLSGIGH